MPAPIVVFDLDGTLVDTAPDLIDTLNVVLSARSIAPVNYEDARSLVGGGAKVMIERALKSEGRAAEPGELDQLFEKFIAHYAEHIADHSKPFPGLETALNELERDGFRFAVCTNKLERLSRLLLDKLALTQRFAFICGQDTFGVAKPDPAPLLRTIDAAGGTSKDAIMVGDSETDIRTARAAGIPVIAVDFGYSERPVSEFSPDRVIGKFAALPAAVRKLMSKR